jgi:hypothetical protein
MACDVLIIGSGSLAETTLRAMALQNPEPLRVAVMGRSRERADILAALGNAMAGAFHRPIRFEGDRIDWDDPGDLPAKLDKHAPRLILHTASLQTPWDFLGAADETRWKQLVVSAGNAVLVPMQVALVKRVAMYIQTMNPRPILLNTCFPDHVNPILKHMGLPIDSGIGNVAKFAACLRWRYPAPRHKVQVIGHLYHYYKILGTTHDPDLDGPRVWIDGEEVPDVEVDLKDAFHDLRSINAKGKIINELVGANAAEAIQGMLGDTPLETHVPGPNGLPGGYPVIMARGRVELDLPAGISEQEAIALNAQGAYDMGTSVIDAEGYSGFSSTAQGLLADYLPGLEKGFHVDELDQVTAALARLRDALENQPAVPA